MLKCKHCQSEKVVFDYNTQEHICSKCGVSEIKPNNMQIERHGPHSIYSSERGSYIDTLPKTQHQNFYNHKSTYISKKNRVKFEKIFDIEKRIGGSHERVGIPKMNYYINLLSERLGINSHNVKERALSIYDKFYAVTDYPKVPDCAIMSQVCLYIAIKEHGIPKSFRDLQRVIKKERLGGNYRNINSFFKVQFLVQNTLGLKNEPDPNMPISMAMTIAKALDLPLAVTEKTIQVLNVVRSELWYNQSIPQDIAAGALWYVYKHIFNKGNTKKGETIRMEAFADEAKGNVVSLRRVSRLISEAYEKKTKGIETEREEEEKEPIHISIPKFGNQEG